MATIVGDFDNFIEYIVSAFEAEMHNLERNNIWGAIANRTPYPEHEQQRNTLRSALRRVLGTEEQPAE